jgi:hypothetical protein
MTETCLDKPRALKRFLFNFARRANKGAIQRAAEWTGHAYLRARNGPQLKRLIRLQIAPDLHRIVALVNDLTGEFFRALARVRTAPRAEAAPAPAVLFANCSMPT